MSVVAFFQAAKRIYGFCPCCGELFLLSDATLFTRTAPPKTVFDKMRLQQDRLDELIASFDEREEVVREAATRQGQLDAKRRLKRIAPFFVGRGIDPQDVKVIFDPVRYVVFRGLTARSMSAIELIDCPAATTRHEGVQRSIADAIDAGNLEWRTLRIDGDGHVKCER